jgi:hypothetical protein
MGADKDREVYWRGALQAIKTGAEVPVLLGKRRDHWDALGALIKR